MNVYSIFKELVRCFALHPSTAQKEDRILTPFSKKFEIFFCNKKSACPHFFFEVGQTQRKTPLSMHSVG